jgi:hypothetical protein
MIKNLFCFLSIVSIVCFSESIAQTKHALLIGVGLYPNRTDGASWSDLSSKNDIDLVKTMLRNQKFDEKNIVEILDEKATAVNVMKALDALLAKINPGDIVYIHYSGHGQQIADWDAKDYPNVKYIAKDEGEDGYDEALALYNAPMEYFEGYKYDEHLIDDQLDYYVSAIESKLGKNGHVVIVLDSCHSGSATRGSEPTKKRGSEKVCAPKNYRKTYNIEDNKGYKSGEGVKSIFMGCKDEQVNYEIVVNEVGYGSLTYCIVEAITNLNGQASYKNVFDIVYGKLLINSGGQQNAENDFDEANSLFFGGSTVPKSEYFEVQYSMMNEKIAKVGAGMVHGISVGDTLAFYYIDPSKPNSILSRGVVTEVEGGKCKVLLNSALPMNKKDDYALFRTKRIFEVITGQQLKLALDIQNKDNIKIIKNALKEEKNILIVDPKKDAPNYYIKEDKENKVRIEIPFSGNPLKEMKPLSMNNTEDVDKLKEFLKQALRIDYFTNLELSDERIDVTVQLKQMSDSALQVKKKEILNDPNYKNAANIRAFEIEVANNSSDLIYLHAVYIGNNKIIGEIPISRDGKDDFVKLYPNTKKKSSSFQPIVTFCTPDLDCGVDRIYFFASLEKMDFEAVEKLGESLSTRGSEDAFIKLISDGAAGKNQSANSMSGVQLIKYEISNMPTN